MLVAKVEGPARVATAVEGAVETAGPTLAAAQREAKVSFSLGGASLEEKNLHFQGS